MKRLPLVAFIVFAVMSAAAVFIVQSIKTSDPYVWKTPIPRPQAFDPSASTGCRSTALAFMLQAKADNVDVSVISSSTGDQVKQLAANVPMKIMTRKTFVWKGDSAGGKTVPAGSYYFRLYLIHQDHTIDLNYAPVSVTSTAQTAASAGC